MKRSPEINVFIYVGSAKKFVWFSLPWYKTQMNFLANTIYSLTYSVIICSPNLFLKLISLFMSAPSLCCCVPALSSCSEWGSSVWCVGSRCSGVSSCRARTLGFSSHGAGTLLRGMWNLPGPCIQPVSPALAGILLITGPPAKFSSPILNARY